MKKTAIMITIAILALVSVLIVAVAASKRRAPAVDPSETIEERVNTLCNNYEELTQQEADNLVNTIHQKSHTIIEVLNSMIHGAEDEIKDTSVQEGSGKGGRL